MKKIISGIQQIGIGVSDVHEAWKWYRQYFGMDIPIFEEAATADLMQRYTGGKPRERHAVLAYNLQGGSGFEIWQYTSRDPQPPAFNIRLGDTGIFAAKMKARDVHATHRAFVAKGLDVLGEVRNDPEGTGHFFLRDPYGNIFEILQNTHWFKGGKSLTGGPFGAIIGVSDINKSMAVYRDLLEYDQIVFDNTGTFSALDVLPGGESTFRRVLLRHSKPRAGLFCRLFGPSQIELVEVKDRKPRHIYEDRYWGDLGFIHLCFDIFGMDALRNECARKGFPFTVDSANSFNMGEAAGHFSYITDPDGTLIEFVETHKIPIIKKIGWYMNVYKRHGKKPLPNWILKALKWSRVRD